MRAKTCFSSLWQMFCWWYYFFSRLPFHELGKSRVKFACALYVCSYIDNFLLIVAILLANVYWRCWWYLLFCACWLFLDSGKQRVQRACALFVRATCSRNSQTPPAPAACQFTPACPTVIIVLCGQCDKLIATSAWHIVPAQESKISRKWLVGKSLTFSFLKIIRQLLLFARLSYYFTPVLA